MREKYTRIDNVRSVLDRELKKITDEEVKRCAYVHLYGTGQSCAIIALKRGFDTKYAELAEVAGMLHDIYKFTNDDKKDHAHLGAPLAKEILQNSCSFSPEEIELICNAIYNHSDKEITGNVFDEILKDADEMQHYLRNPDEDYLKDDARVVRTLKEFGINL